MPFECNSLGCYKAHYISKWKIFQKEAWHILHLNINSLLPKINETRFIAKQSIASVIEISESKLDSFILNSELDIRLDHSKRGGRVACYIRKFLSYKPPTSFCPNIESIFIDIFFLTNFGRSAILTS